MVAFSRIQGLTGSISPLGAALAGIATVAAATLMPAVTLENLVWTSGIAALVPAAEPPLGVTARAVLALAGGAGAAAVTWAALYLLFGRGGYFNRVAKGEAGAPAVRRADAHPDAPPRRPMSAADLGTPLMEVVPAATREPAKAAERAPVKAAERAPVMASVTPPAVALPADLDTPLARFDPEAIRAPARGTAALAPGERLDTFALATPAVRFGEPERTEPVAAPSLDALIRRLEQGAQRRATQG
jgi:hypothetical protein